jgi:hypothetical protein
MKSNHQALVVRIGEILVHPNADNLQIVNVMDGAYQCVIDEQPQDGSIWSWPGNWGFPLTVPVVYNGVMGPEVFTKVDGPSLVVGAKNIREGVVIRRKDNGVTLKIHSNAFLEKDSK